MNLTSILALFISGVALLLISSRLLVEVSKQLAEKWKLSPLFISLVLVSLGTNLPEFTVLISSLLSGDAGLAMGNVVGSNISNITLIFGAGIILHSPKIGTVKTQKNNLLMLLLTVIFVAMEFLPIHRLIKGITLLIFLFGFIVYEYSLAKYGQLHEDKNLFEKIEDKIEDTTDDVFNQGGSILISVLAIVGAIFGLGVGSDLIVGSVNQLATLLNISTTLIGITLVATTTSLPEMITIIIAGAKKEDKIVVGTLIGSNIYNLAMFVPILQFSPYNIGLSNSDLIYLLFSVCFFAYVIISSKGKRVPKMYGAVSIAIFIFFLITSFS
ncbi:MAG: sodium:calcium antiporter [Candidatus Pacebacteria bacterium]|nr:sodium:calcium antiporter [Candidatus Paceibacterota bacterium]